MRKALLEWRYVASERLYGDTVNEVLLRHRLRTSLSRWIRFVVAKSSDNKQMSDAKLQLPYFALVLLCQSICDTVKPSLLRDETRRFGVRFRVVLVLGLSIRVPPLREFQTAWHRGEKLC